MNGQGKLVKKIADALAIVLIVMIFGGILGATGLPAILSPESSEPLTEGISFGTEEISSLEVEAGAADISFLQGESLSVEFDKNSFTVKEHGGRITVRERSNFLNLNKSRSLKIFIPENFSFEKVKLETGASNVEGQLLRAQKLDLDSGAGLVVFDKLEVTQKAELDCGAGEVTVRSGTLGSLDFSLGVGLADITAELKGNSEIESGVGELSLHLPDGKENYCFNIETGLGAIVFDGSSVKGETVIGNGENSVSLEGGVGSVKVSFDTQSLIN